MQASISRCCIEYKQQARHQKDDGTRKNVRLRDRKMMEVSESLPVKLAAHNSTDDLYALMIILISDDSEFSRKTAPIHRS
jgi:hypothetical protein